jgi:hypothetical protein
MIASGFAATALIKRAALATRSSREKQILKRQSKDYKKQRLLAVSRPRPSHPAQSKKVDFTQRLAPDRRLAVALRLGY